MNYKKKDLQKQAFCTTRAKYDFGDMDVSSAGSKPLTMYQIVTETIKGTLNGEFERKEAEEIINSAGELSPLPAEDKAIKLSAITMVQNFFALAYDRVKNGTCTIVADSVQVELPYAEDGSTATIRPDVVFDDGLELEVCFLKTGSAYVMGDEFLPSMYNGILYGRTLVPEGETRRILCSYYELKKAKIQSVVEDIWPLPAGIDSDLDEKAKTEFEELSGGIVCEGKDCSFCPGRFECQYQAPALAVEGEKIIKPKKVKLSVPQQSVQAFGA